MDELQFHPSEWTPGDTKFENPNYHELMEKVEHEYQDEDFRTEEERAADELLQQQFDPQGEAEFPVGEETPLDLNPEDWV